MDAFMYGLLGFSVVAMFAALSGGSVKGLSIEIPALTSGFKRSAVFALGLLLCGFASHSMKWWSLDPTLVLRPSDVLIQPGASASPSADAVQSTLADPSGSNSKLDWAHADTCFRLRLARRFDEAKAECGAALEMLGTTANARAHHMRGAVWHDLGRIAECRGDFSGAKNAYRLSIEFRDRALKLPNQIDPLHRHIVDARERVSDRLHYLIDTHGLRCD